MNADNKEKSMEKLSIGQWTINPESGLLSNGTKAEVYLELRLAKLFYLLFIKANKLVPRKYLMDEIWNDTIVNEESLTKAVSDLRKILKAHFDNPPEILTIPKRGYKMTIPETAKSPLMRIVMIYFWFALLGFILLVLIIRGLNY